MRIFLRFVFSMLIVCNAYADNTNHALEVVPLTDNVYLHTSYKEVEGYGLVGSNGLVVVDAGKAYIIDTPWSEADTKKLVDLFRQRGLVIAGSISTHFHDDRTSGIGFLNSMAIPTYASNLTNDILTANGAAAAKNTFSTKEFSWVPGVIEVYFPGAGHTKDNVVVWLPQSNVLFGGCLVRESSGKKLGNIADAEIGAWEHSIDNLINKFPTAKIVVPGHGAAGGPELLAHTKLLAKSATSRDITPHSPPPIH